MPIFHLRAMRPMPFLRPTRRSLVPVAFVALAALATYIRTLGYDFAFDDHLVIPVTWQVGAGSALEAVQAPVRAGDVVLAYFRPLTALCYWLDGVVWHGNPGGFHLTNLLWHTLVSVLVLLVSRRLLPDGPGPVFAGLLFAVHPVHVEAVAWVQGRVDLLSTAGVLSAVLLGVAGLDTTGRRRALCFLGSATTVLLALLAKEVAVVAPLLTVIVLAGQPGRVDRERIRAWLSLFALQGAAFLVYFGLRMAALRSPALGLAGGPAITDRVILLLRVVPIYLRLLVWPLGLNPKHHVTPPSGFLNEGVLWGVALLTAITAIVWLWRRRSPGLGPGVAWLAIAWLPVSNLVPIAGFVVAERYLYLPSVGLCIAAAGAAAQCTASHHRWRPVLVSVAAALLLTLGGLAASQGETWRDMRTFYERLVRLNPDSALAHNNLGSVYLGLGEDALAETELREALRLEPGHVGALNNFGILAQRRRDLTQAKRFYREALKARPNHADVWNNLGTLYETEGALGEAATAYGQAVRLDSTVARFKANLAGVFAAQGRQPEAASLFEQAIRMDPTVLRWQEALARLRSDQRSKDGP